MDEIGRMQRDSHPSSLVHHGCKGRLGLSFQRPAGATQTVLTVYEQEAPLKLVRAFPLKGGGSLVHLHNLSGGVLGGDRLELRVGVDPGAWAQLTSTGATRLYRSRPAGPTAVQINEIRVEDGGLLEYLPDPLIPFAGSRYRQETTINLAAGAGLFWWETIAPGREARGEVFDYDLLKVRLDIVAEGRPVALDRFKLEPRLRPLSSAVRLGPYRYYSSLYICRVGIEASRWRALEESLGELVQRLSRPGEVLWGVSTLAAHGLVVRAVSRQGRDIASGLLAFWRAAKMELYGQEAVRPRKIY
jgi:urease accessory protein